MPSAFTPRIPFEDDAWLGTRASKNGEYWYLRVRWKQKAAYHFQSLRLKYEPSEASINLARKKAERHYERMLRSIRAGVQPNVRLTPEFLRIKYLADIKEKAYKNDELSLPIHRVEGGRGFWSVQRYLDVKAKIGRTLEEKQSGKKDEDRKRVAEPGPIEIFFKEELPSQLVKIRQRDLQKFLPWAMERYEWAPATVNRALVQIRMMWRFAHNQGWVDFVPTLSQQPAQLIERQRRKLKPDEYKRIHETARKRYQDILDLPEDERDNQKLDLYYQFHLWILIVSNTGIRPPEGRVERLLIRWEDIHETSDGSRFLKRRNEKSHLNYEAVIQPNAHQYIDALRDLQKRRGVKTDYLFAHTFDKLNRRGFRKGDPIKSFKRQWDTTLKLAGLDSPVGTPQRDKLVPYSLRAWFMTNRLESSDTLRVEDLARATGTSPEIITKLYYDFSTRRMARELTKGVIDRSHLKPVYKDGYYIGREEDITDKMIEELAAGKKLSPEKMAELHKAFNEGD
jgi:site-specific recombinase XerD